MPCPETGRNITSFPVAAHCFIMPRTPHAKAERLMFKLFGEKPDHPLYDLDETRRLLDELPLDDAKKSLEEITFWLESIKDAAGFAPQLRTDIILLLDEAGQPHLTELLRLYLSAPHLRDFQGLHLWRGIYAFAQALSAAYAACIGAYPNNGKKSGDPKERIALVCVRQLRAVAERMNLELMRYIEVDPSVWQLLCACYRFAEAQQCTDSMVFAYPGHVVHTNPQRELLRALVLYISSPDTLAPDQIEVSYRIAGRMSSFFDLKTTADAGSPYVFDLATDTPPHRADNAATTTPTMRFFGTARALPGLHNIIGQNENDPAWQERRFGNEFTPAGKLTVLKHLLRYWAAEPPHRHLERRNLNASIEVAHGFQNISRLVTHISGGVQPEQQAAAPQAQDGLGLASEATAAVAAAATANNATEVWHLSDMSAADIGATLTGSLGAWIKIGDLCALKPQNGQLWWVGVIQRLHTDADGKVHVGIELLAKKPAAVRLHVLAAETPPSAKDAADAHDYQTVILLPDEHNSYLHATMLMEPGRFAANARYRAMMGDNSRELKLGGLIAEGEDYEQVGFEWLL